MAAVRPVVEEFAARMFADLPRRDQRAKGALYLRGLMLDGKRKSLQPMAERLGVDHQGLQHHGPGNPTAATRSRFLAVRVRPGGPDDPRDAERRLPECWLLAEWLPGQAEPTDYWLSTLPADIPLGRLVRLAKLRWRIEHDYRELKDGLGLDHYEGRSFDGWHRHTTLVSFAQALCTQLRRTPKAPAPA
jgi:SRSO17 transposase